MSCQLENPSHRVYVPRPVLFQFSKVLSPSFRQRVVTSTSIVLRGVPARFQPTRLLHAMQRGIEGALLHREDVLRGAFDALRDVVAVQRFPLGQGSEHQEIERPVQAVVLGMPR